MVTDRKPQRTDDADKPFADGQSPGGNAVVQEREISVDSVDGLPRGVPDVGGQVWVRRLDALIDDADEHARIARLAPGPGLARTRSVLIGVGEVASPYMPQ